MTADASDQLPGRPQAHRGLPPGFGPLLLWLAIQLAILWLSAAGVPLSEHFPQPAQRLALAEMLIVQTLASAMLFPLLLRGAGQSIMLIAASWPMTQLAGFLSATDERRLLAAGGFVTAWMAGLALWNVVLRSRKSHLYGSALALVLALFPPALEYLRAEFAASGASDPWANMTWAGPILGELAILFQRPAVAPWAFAGVFLATSATAALLVRLLRHSPAAA